jgi:hypothetical protein
LTAPTFLSAFGLRPVNLPANTPYLQVGLALGKGAAALEVLVTTAKSHPQPAKVRSLWRERNNKQAAPLLVVVLYDGKAMVCGTGGDDPPAYAGVDLGQAERICREALEQPDRHVALRFFRDVLPAVVDTRLPGLRNEGFLATHELAVGARHLDAWSDADRKARPALPQRGETLLHALGFKIERCDQITSILRAGPGGNMLAVAVLLHQQQGIVVAFIPGLPQGEDNGLPRSDTQRYSHTGETMPLVRGDRGHHRTDRALGVGQVRGPAVNGKGAGRPQGERVSEGDSQAQAEGMTQGGHPMTLRGHVENGVVVLDQSGALPDGTRVTVRPIADKSKGRKSERPLTVSKELASLSGQATDLPDDAARNLDHYLYGHPKR